MTWLVQLVACRGFTTCSRLHRSKEVKLRNTHEVYLPLPTISSHLSFYSFRFSSLIVCSAYALMDILILSGLEQADLASSSASSFPLIPVWAGIHATSILHPSFLSNHLSIPLLIIFSIYWLDDGFISYVVLTMAALSM
jgi:hypothetical protein